MAITILSHCNLRQAEMASLVIALLNKCNLLEFTACYVGLILAPAEGFGAFGPCWVAFSHRGGPLGHHLPYLPLY